MGVSVRRRQAGVGREVRRPAIPGGRRRWQASLPGWLAIVLVVVPFVVFLGLNAHREYGAYELYRATSYFSPRPPLPPWIWVPLHTFTTMNFFRVIFQPINLALGLAVAFILCTVAGAGYFAARRRANAIGDHLDQAVRLGHPLPESLRIAGEGERGKLAGSLLATAELLRRGKPLDESLAVAAPEISRRDLAIIADAGTSGKLPQALERLRAERAVWHYSGELLPMYIAYAATLLLVLFLALAVAWGVILPKAIYGLGAFSPPATVPLPARQHLEVLWSHAAAATSACFFFASLLIGSAAAVVLLRWVFTPYGHRWRWTGWLWDRALWCFPVARSLERSRSWAAAMDVLAHGVEEGDEFPALVESAANAGVNGRARRKLLVWKKALENGAAIDAAARAAHLPRLICNMLPADNTGSLPGALACLHAWYRHRFTQWADMIRGAFIPVFVLGCGIVVLGVTLLLWAPYVELIRLLELQGPL